MVDECLIRYGSQRLGQGAWDDTTGNYTVPTEQILYQGPCMVTQQGHTRTTTERSGGAEVTIDYYVIRIPLQDPAPDIWDEDEIQITAVHPDGDHAILGTVFIAESIDDSTYSVCHNIHSILRRPVPG